MTVTAKEPDEYVVVWRAVEGSAVQTYALPDKRPRVFATTPEAPEAADAIWVDDDALGVLLEGREEFGHRRVSRSAARQLLGWDV